ncbi:UNVERIFIED_CONTAM: hypothetical protein HDU68_000896, partial [Siphonaria sp. JEL0065]
IPEAYTLVEELLSAFQTQLQLTEINELRQGFLRMVVLQSRLFEFCGDDIEDRNLLTLAFDVARERNKNLINNMFTAMTNY